jgi:hypothetical protein
MLPCLERVAFLGGPRRLALPLLAIISVLCTFFQPGLVGTGCWVEKPHDTTLDHVRSGKVHDRGDEAQR